MLEYLNSYIFLTCIALFGYNYVLNRNANTNAFMEKGVKLYYFLNEFFKYYNHSLYPDYFEYHIGLLEGSCHNSTDSTDPANTANPPEEKYETKYLSTIRAFQNDWDFDENGNVIPGNPDVKIDDEKRYEQYFSDVQPPYIFNKNKIKLADLLSLSPSRQLNNMDQSGNNKPNLFKKL